MTDDTFMDDDFDDLKDLFAEPRPFDWPYDGPRTVTLLGVTAEVTEKFPAIYGDDGRRVEFGTEHKYDPDDLPAGYESRNKVELVLNQAVDDKVNPENPNTPRIGLGDVGNVEVNGDGTKFRFISDDGTPRTPRNDHTFALFAATVLNLLPRDERKAFRAGLVDADKWFSASIFDGTTAVWDAVKVGKATKAKAWPIEAAVEASAGSAPSKDVTELAKLATSATEFRDLVVTAGIGDSSIVAKVAANAEGAWEAAKAGTL